MPAPYPLLITFDCASTIVNVGMREDGLLALAAKMHGIELSQDDLAHYRTTFQSQWSTYCDVNKSGEAARCDQFWLDAIRVVLPTANVDTIYRTAQELAFGSPSHVFTVYDDVIPCFERLQSAGVRLGVISNWDFTLAPALEATGLMPYFDFTIASLVFGVEKPDPRIFEEAMRLSGLERDQVVHVGDDLDDDIAGAQRAGIRSIHLDRWSPPDATRIRSLDDLEAALAWSR